MDAPCAKGAQLSAQPGAEGGGGNTEKEGKLKVSLCGPVQKEKCARLGLGDAGGDGAGLARQRAAQPRRDCGRVREDRGAGGRGAPEEDCEAAGGEEVADIEHLAELTLLRRSGCGGS